LIETWFGVLGEGKFFLAALIRGLHGELQTQCCPTAWSITKRRRPAEIFANTPNRAQSNAAATCFAQFGGGAESILEQEGNQFIFAAGWSTLFLRFATESIPVDPTSVVDHLYNHSVVFLSGVYLDQGRWTSRCPFAGPYKAMIQGIRYSMQEDLMRAMQNVRFPLKDPVLDQYALAGDSLGIQTLLHILGIDPCVCVKIFRDVVTVSE
jgi:hypothetical protein